MFVEQILPRAQKRLAKISSHAFLTEAAELMLTPETDILVVCKTGVMVGVITKTDIVAQVHRHRSGSGFQVPVDTIMTREVASCRLHDPLHDVWQVMKTRNFRRIPILDTADRPVGIVSMRDALQGLWNQAEIEDEFLRDYIAGVGYR
ncbi:CBS domain-containing protein [Terrihabitans soli]|uniref:CBS domain-containing protein n=1 Tax=Terrihabitans soli TaxID=708113 RepID=A0A6S6QS71_9HYPH|nr:CBS domain-containing protein [Terrihabitans soli]BCJ90555.1 CBS domain-containing protein [Terrihabitans soli]